ncbi:hypothetical protein HF234_003741 [Salmonella enterica]|nr:hypothetical protein [Salmonella enterica]
MAAKGDPLTDGQGTVHFYAELAMGTCVIHPPPDVTFSFGEGDVHKTDTANRIIASKVLTFNIADCGGQDMFLSASTSDSRVAGNEGRYAALTPPASGNHSLWYQASLSIDGGQHWSALTWNSTGTHFTVAPTDYNTPDKQDELRLKIELVASGQTSVAGTYRGNFTYNFTYR